MRTFQLIFAAWFGFQPIAASAAPAEGEAVDLSEAQRLFNQGTARYEAADYEGAIEVFTLALGELRDQGVDDFRTLGLLLFNIGRSHMRAYEINRDIEHLRQGRAIFERLLAAAESSPDEIDEADVAEARAQLEAIEQELRRHEAEQSEPAEPATPAGGQDSGADAKRARARGVGLTAAGIALLGGGVGMLVWGLGYGPAAEAQVGDLDQLGLPADSPAFEDADTFVTDERRKGTAWMAAGGVTAALGVTGLAIGIQQLVRAKRLDARRVDVSAMVSSEGVWLGVGGRF